jgi:hypothetical protein
VSLSEFDSSIINHIIMDRLDHTNLDFERLAELCSPFVQDLVMYVITNMHEELEAFLKEYCQGK